MEYMFLLRSNQDPAVIYITRRTAVALAPETLGWRRPLRGNT
jgi:hypothetical protein